MGFPQLRAAPTAPGDGLSSEDCRGRHDAPSEEMVHFMAIEDPAGDFSPEAGARQRPCEHDPTPGDRGFVLRESPELKLERRVSERSESA